MATSSTTMQALGTKAPDFQLNDVVSGEVVSLTNYTNAPALLIMFICQHCPYVQHVKHELAKLGQDYALRGVGIVAISSNDANSYPEDSPEKLKAMANELKLNFPLCYDENQDVAKAYDASCTPEFFLYDHSQKLVYHGQLDNSRPGNSEPVTGADLRQALDAVLNNQPVVQEQKPSIGCGIKWRA